MKKLSIILCLSILAASCSDKKLDSKVPLKTANDSFSYSLGALIGSKMLKPKKVKEINWEAFKAALEYSMQKGDSGLAINKDELDVVLERYVNSVAYAEDKQKSADFLAKKKKEGGYTVTESGLLFKVVKPGNGVKPTITDSIMVYYTGSFISGEVFDSNMDGKPMKTGLNSGLIKGFLEALQMMEEGSEAEVIIPYQLAYGEKGQVNPYTGQTIMEPYQTLVFKLKIDKILK